LYVSRQLAPGHFSSILNEDIDMRQSNVNMNKGSQAAADVSILVSAIFSFKARNASSISYHHTLSEI